MGGCGVRSLLARSDLWTVDGKYPGDKAWEQFGDTVGWRKNGQWLSYDELEPSFSSPQGNFPFWWGWWLVVLGLGRVGCWVFVSSLLSHRDL